MSKAECYMPNVLGLVRSIAVRREQATKVPSTSLRWNERTEMIKELFGIGG